MRFGRLSASWQNGHAAACKAVYAGSIPALAFVKIDNRPGGEIGRRKGLKIPRAKMLVPVRLRPRAPTATVKQVVYRPLSAAWRGCDVPTDKYLARHLAANARLLLVYSIHF